MRSEQNPSADAEAAARRRARYGSLPAPVRPDELTVLVATDASPEEPGPHADRRSWDG
ncbi:MAG TPA: hypothetical protein VES42_29295 [Pilimelia sp.]|nr:hypothetical protein [Pilimelia sp.]